LADRGRSADPATASAAAQGGGTARTEPTKEDLLNQVGTLGAELQKYKDGYTSLSDKIAEVQRAADSTRSETQFPTRDQLLTLYGQITQYDLHYSTVRTGTSTFLIAVALGIGQFGIEKSQAPLDRTIIGFIVPFIVLIFAFSLGCHFQRLTASCKIYQEWIERLLEQAPQHSDRDHDRCQIS
jgi:hypothetical protein